MMLGRTRLWTAILTVALSPHPAQALLCGTIFNPISISATSIAYGNYTANSPTPLTAIGTVTIECGLLGLDILPNFEVSLSTGSSGNYIPRTMLNGGDSLNYNIYTTSAHATVWGDGTGSTVTQTYQTILNLGTIDFIAYGQVPSSQFVPPGVYIDTITVTVTY